MKMLGLTDKVSVNDSDKDIFKYSVISPPGLQHNAMHCNTRPTATQLSINEVEHT